MFSNAAAMNANRGIHSVTPWHLTRKVVVLLMLVLGLSLGLVVLERRGHPAPLVLFNLLADLSIGLIMGLGSRLLFRLHHWTMRALIAAALSIVGLAFLGQLTAYSSGIGPLTHGQVSVDSLARFGIALQVPTLPRQNLTDGADAAHMMIAAGMSWIALRAWTRARRPQGSRPSMDYRPAQRSETSTVSLVSPTPRMAAVSSNVSAGRPGPKVRAGYVRRPRIVRATAIPLGRGGSRSRGRSRARAAVQLAAYEEHRCPYCLQDIQRDDVRGSVECPICHTLHHKDCWNITGTCQVPHLNG